MFLGVGAFGRFSWMSGILVVILMSLEGLGLELFPKEFVKLLSGLLQLVTFGFSGLAGTGSWQVSS